MSRTDVRRDNTRRDCVQELIEQRDGDVGKREREREGGLCG